MEPANREVRVREKACLALKGLACNPTLCGNVGARESFFSSHTERVILRLLHCYRDRSLRDLCAAADDSTEALVSRGALDLSLCCQVLQPLLCKEEDALLQASIRMVCIYFIP